MSTFQKATRKKAKLKLAITGSSGSGKTYGALRLASGMSTKVAYIDTENASASLYSDRFAFDVLDIAPPYNHEKFVDAIKAAVAGGYEVVVIDSASHFWEGILAYKDALDKRGGNSYTNWNEAGNKFKGILDAVLQSPIHIICCMRSKMDYVLETNEKGKQVPRKIGLAPIMRDNIEYEFTTVFDVTMDHNTKTSKDRTGLFGDSIFQITEETGKQLLAWLDKGEEAPKPPPAPVAWTPEQAAEAKRLKAEIIAKMPHKGAADEWEAAFRESVKGASPSDIIDALNLKLKG